MAESLRHPLILFEGIYGMPSSSKTISESITTPKPSPEPMREGDSKVSLRV